MLTALGAGLWLTSSGMWDLRGPDEGRYVQIAKELLTRDNWLYLTVHGVPYDQKPPLAFCLLALMIKFSGGEIISWMLRLPSVLAAMATVLMTYSLGKSSFDRRTGFTAALMLLVSPLFCDNAATAELNMLYTAAITGSMCAWINWSAAGEKSFKRAAVFWILLVFAFFIKGPLAFIIVFSALGWELWSRRSWAGIKNLRPILGFASSILAISLWLYFQSRVYGNAFVKKQVEGETLHRILNGDHAAPVWYYLPRIFTSALFPWAFLLVPALRVFSQKRDPGFNIKSVYAGWFIVPFVLLCLVHGKRQAYLLPLLPPACILLAAYFSAQLADRASGIQIWHWSIRAVNFTGVIAVATGVFFICRPHSIQNDGIWISETGMALTVICGIAIMLNATLLSRADKKNQSLLYSYIGVAAVLLWANFMIVRPAFDKTKTTRYLAEVVEKSLVPRKSKSSGNHSSVSAVGSAAEAELHVYGHYQVTQLKASDVLLYTTRQRPINIIVLVNANGKQYDQLNSYLIKAGFTSRRMIQVSKEWITVFKKEDAASGGGFEKDGSLIPRYADSGKHYKSDVPKEMKE